MTLADYLRREGRGAKTRLQLRTGLAYTTILAIEAGESKPLPDTAKKIEEATEGAVTASELLGLDGAAA